MDEGRMCWMGRVIETEDGRVCPNEATHYFVDTRSSFVMELCTECACWVSMIRKANFGNDDWIIVEPMESLDPKFDHFKRAMENRRSVITMVRSTRLSVDNILRINILPF